MSENGTASTTFTVNTKIAEDEETEAAETRDSNHMALPIILLFVSGGMLILTGAYGKKKRHFAR